jgi:hypothetical protein
MKSDRFAELTERLASGWNTWNVRSVLSHVLLPDGLALNLCLSDPATGAYLRESLIGRQGKDDERVTPGPRSYDGTYTDLTLSWRGIALRVQSAVDDAGELVLLITPLERGMAPPTLVVEAGLLWNRPGHGERQGDRLISCGRSIHLSVPPAADVVNIPAMTAYLACPLEDAVVVSTGGPRTVAEATEILERNRAGVLADRERYGDAGELYAAAQTCLAWDTIYDPSKDRVISPVSRIWSVGLGGWILFCWDTYFAAYIASIDNRDLAYANAIAITQERTTDGFVPNYVNGTGVSSLDRSQPPVGSWVVRELYRKYRDRWLLDLLFDDLLAWNRWWDNRRQIDDLLAWGSNPFPPRFGNYWELNGVNDRFGAALESGLDNSPMYDDVPFDADHHVLKLHDAGLNGLYIADSDALADIAAVLGRDDEATELRQRADRYRAATQRLWDSDLFYNRRTDTGDFDRRISPTNFYPLLGRAASSDQAIAMVDYHLYNPDEFWGEWVLPSIARNDPAYADQEYWRGRIWAPMNFLVYLGLRRYDLPAARSDIAARSAALLLKEWRQHGHVHENYNADTGEGCDSRSSDRLYHWGGLLATIGLIEAGFYPPPEEPL